MTEELEIITPLESQEVNAGEIKRALATVQTVSQLEPIVFTNKEGEEETASAIELASFENIGWHCVVKKDEFKDGNACVYFEIDSIIPKQPWSEFLVDVNRPDKPLRLKTKRMCSVLSQGLAMPISILENYGTLIFDSSSNSYTLTIDEGENDKCERSC